MYVPLAIDGRVDEIVPFLHREDVAFLRQPDNIGDMLVDVNTLAIGPLLDVNIDKVGKVRGKIFAVPTTAK